MKKFLSLALGLALTFVLGSFLGSLLGDTHSAMAAGFVFAGFAFFRIMLQPSMKGAFAFSAFDITALVAALGAYHREHRDLIASEVLLDEVFTNDMEVMDDVTDEVPLPDLQLTDIVKPGLDPTFNPTANALKLGARILKVRDCKVDLLLSPKVLEKTWLGKLKKADDPTDLPFEKFLMQYISSKIVESVRLKAIYKGIYNAAGTGTADTMNGFLKLIADEITATNITPVVTGAITAVNVIDKIEATYDALGEAYKELPSVMKCSPTIFTWYTRKYRADFGGNQDYTGMKRRRVTIDGTNCELVAEPGFGSSQRLVTSVPENFVYGVDSASGYSLDVQKFDRQIKLLIDFKAGVQFKQIHSRGLAVNDQV